MKSPETLLRQPCSDRERAEMYVQCADLNFELGRNKIGEKYELAAGLMLRGHVDMAMNIASEAWTMVESIGMPSPAPASVLIADEIRQLR